MKILKHKGTQENRPFVFGKVDMKTAIIIIVVCIVILLSAGTFYFIYHPLTYCQNYYTVLGLDGCGLYNDIVFHLGHPMKETNAEFGQIFMHYNGFVILHSGKNNGIMQSVRITGEQYRFGYFRIGIGTKRKKLESIYKHIKKIKDLPSNQFGVIENNTWVYFEFDEHDCVSKITLTLLGP